MREMWETQRIVEVKVERKFEAGHRIPNALYTPCRQFHGHSYQISVVVGIDVESVRDKFSEVGYPIDFSILKSIIDQELPDHKFIIWKDDEYISSLKSIFGDKFYENFYVMEYPPSAENISLYLKVRIENKLKGLYGNSILFVKVCLKEGVSGGEVQV